MIFNYWISKYLYYNFSEFPEIDFQTYCFVIFYYVYFFSKLKLNIYTYNLNGDVMVLVRI